MQQQIRTYYAGTTQTVTEQRNTATLVTVEVYTPHSRNNPKLVRRVLTYGAKFDTYVGQTVLVPPTQLQPKWSKGKVLAIDNLSGYRGRIKYVAPLGRRK